MKRSLRIVLSLVSGILLSLAWLGFPGWILFVALLPLLFLDDFFVNEKENYRGVSFFGHALLAFFIWNLVTTWWIMHASPAGAATAIILNSFFMALIWWLGHTARRRFSKNLGYLALIVFYLSFEFLHYHWDIEWPWLTLGNGFANNVKMVQWYEYTGVFGGSLWVLTVNILIYKILKKLVKKESFRHFLIEWISLAFIMLLPLSLSFGMYFNYSEEKNPKEIVLVQPNVNPYSESYTVAAEKKKLQKFIGLARKEAGNNTDFIVGPETVFERYPEWEVSRIEYLQAYRELNNLIQGYPEAELMIGLSSSKIYGPGEKPSETARSMNGTSYDVYNSALFINRAGESQLYHKSILVSGVEKVPYMKYLGFLKNLIIDLGGTSGNLGRQDEPTNFIASDGTEIAPAICYESIFGEYMTEFVRNGAGFIFIITNDGWWKDTPGYRQHLSFARLRAIETRRSVARAANTGISAFINQRGDILRQTDWWEDAVIKGTLNANNRITFYTQQGDYLARIASFLSVLLLLWLLTEKLRGINPKTKAGK